MTFLLGRQAMFGQEPPTYFRSTTTVFIPFLARVQERSLPAAPLPRMSRSYSSPSMAGAGLPAVLGSSKCCVVFILFPLFLFISLSAGCSGDRCAIQLFQSLKDIIRIKPARIVHIHVGQ